MWWDAAWLDGAETSLLKLLYIKVNMLEEIQPRMLCNGNGVISHLQTETGFFEDFRYSMYNS